MPDRCPMGMTPEKQCGLGRGNSWDAAPTAVVSHEAVYFSAIKTNLSPLSLILVRKNTQLIEEVGLDNLLRSFLESS